MAITVIANPTALCFKEGTLVETEDGLKPIEEIKEGDLVLAFDEQTGEQAFKPVVQLFRNTTDKWYHIIANGEEIICTAEHPFFVVGLGFVPAKNLSVTDKLLSSDNAIVDIDSISIETLSIPETTYNFEVAGFHTYYVGEQLLIVHNGCGAYEVIDENGETIYVGKGDRNRALVSMKSKGGANVKICKLDGKTNDFSFMVEAKKIEQLGGIGGNNLLNKINSPGVKIFAKASTSVQEEVISYLSKFVIK